MQRYPLKLFLKDYIATGGICAAAAADIFLWIYVFNRSRILGDSAFLQYSIHFGVDMIGAWQRFLAMPVFGLIIFIVHTALGYWLYAQAKEIARFVLVSQAVLNIFLIIGAAALFFIN